MKILLVIALVLVLLIAGCTQQPTGKSLNEQQSKNQSQSSIKKCIPNWQCQPWSSCSLEGMHSRTCTDSNNCGVMSGKPSGIEECTVLLETVKLNAINVSYDSLMRNTNSYIGKIVYFRGQVAQVLEGYGNSYGLRIYVTKAPYWSDDIYVNYEGERLLENDIIDLWGRLKGLTTYKTVLGKDVTVPEIDSIEAEFVTKECSYGFIYNGNECVECGNKDQPCCDNSKCTLSMYATCINNKCVKCGGLKEPCCSNNECSIGMLECVNGFCENCGDTGQYCCGNYCFIGLCQNGICTH